MQFRTPFVATLFLVAFSLLEASALKVDKIDKIDKPNNNNSDLVLALQQCSGATRWTLHGLWPNWGSECTNEEFDVNQVALIKANMTKFWSSCPEYGQSNVEFWSHEWSKHGTCMHGATQLQFFTLGLQLYEKYTDTCSDQSRTCDTCLTPSYSLCSSRR